MIWVRSSNMIATFERDSLTGTPSGCIAILQVTGGDARKASRHAPAINLDAFGVIT